MKCTAKLFKNKKSEIFLNSHASLENKRRIREFHRLSSTTTRTLFPNLPKM
ncbi:MAG: hypothetical protein LBR15_04420 [Methanobrevibacter sp.]|nr:hypothetical protein [Candidatus Methanovirga australis]